MEVMCAILILGVALVGLTMGVTTALSSSKESELQTTAALLAAGQIELLRVDDFLTDGTEEGDGGEGLSRYRWKQTISRTDIDGLHEVLVTVESASTGNAIYELRTLLFQPPSEIADPKDRSNTKSKKRDGRRS